MGRFLITGGAGFIGSALTRGLLAKGAERVVVVDNLMSGNEGNLAEIRGAIDFHNIDIRDYDALRASMEGVEVVFHEAAIPSVPRSINDPIPSHDVNINGTFNVLQAAKAAGVRRVIYAASSSAYGDSLVLPKVETMPANPKSPYAAQKLLGEYYMSIWHSCFDLDTISLRYFNVFGPRQDPSSPYSGVLSLFMTAILERRTPTIFGDGEHSRDFTYVEDVVALNIKAAEAPSSVCGRMYNGGNGGRVTLNEAWALLQKIEGVTLPPNYAAPRAGDVKDSQADDTDARQYLGHDPQYSFEQGMRATLAWYRDSLKTSA
jgi:nucleoside-diphosphate-sugar epimerase